MCTSSVTGASGGSTSLRSCRVASSGATPFLIRCARRAASWTSSAMGPRVPCLRSAVATFLWAR
eukprot:9898362-Lingulodinium_polyedra.AAC.1